ncbi:MAG: FHA domain-containing protein [Muribaculaceae bacterium]|nr:FHA domain-containing protein [Muribaculaceae bacterium]
MNDILSLKCPECGAVLTIKAQPGMESKFITCPSCEIKNPFVKFRKVVPQQKAEQDPPTDYGYGHRRPQPEEKTQYRHSEEHTQYQQQDPKTRTGEGLNRNMTVGVLRLAGSNTTFQLKPGRNVVGRKSSNSGADFQIETGDKRSMSREHIVIDVKRHPANGIIHCLSLFKEKVNKTFVGSEQLLPGDVIILQPGHIIKLPDAVLKFDIPDEERTSI